jgi:hypothetical protein
MTNASPNAKKFAAATASPQCGDLMAPTPTTSVQMDVEIHTGETGDPESPHYFDLVVTHPNGFKISEEHRCMNEAEARARKAAGSSGTVTIVYAD